VKRSRAQRPRQVSFIVRLQIMAAPFIIIEHGAPRIADELPPFGANRLGVIGRFWEQTHAFDQACAYRVSVTDAPSYGWFTRLLTYTIYNPPVPLASQWTVSGKYDPSAILALVDAGLEQDDDIIQQWFEAEQVMKLLAAADSYAKMVLAVNCICGAHETSDEAQRYVESVLGKNWCPE
jgi:hypothetical protein